MDKDSNEKKRNYSKSGNDYLKLKKICLSSKIQSAMADTLSQKVVDLFQNYFQSMMHEVEMKIDEYIDTKMRFINLNSELPPHIIQIIFSKLPIVKLPFCRLVCKAWNDMILDYASTCKFVSNTFFAHISCPYNNLHCIDFHAKPLGMSIVSSFRLNSEWLEFAIVNSCNGLLCFTKSLDLKFHVGILNPMTKEYIQVPKGDVRNVDVFYGLGFSPKTNQYKITRHFFITRNHTSLVEIFTFGRINEWSHVGSVPLFLDGHGAYFDGALYWVGFNPQRQRRNVVCRLDVEDEKFEEISSPEVWENRNYCCLAFGRFNGSLYATIYNTSCYNYEVWKMEKEGLWSKAFIVGSKSWVHNWKPKKIYHLRLIKACEDGKILCLVRGIHLILYDLKTGRIETLDQNERIRQHLWVYQIDSLKFGSLQKILVGDG